jgi:DNA-binding transcriptional regulator YiaG
MCRFRSYEGIDWNYNYYYNINKSQKWVITNSMISFISPLKAQQTIARNLRGHRLQLDLTQEGLASRSGVPLATLRKFEQQGVISLESLLKLLMALGMLDAMVKATEVPQGSFSSIDEIIALESVSKRKRGRNS